MAKHVGVSGIYERLGKEIIKKSMVGQDGSWKQREHASPFQVLLKLMLTYGKGRTW
jgi:hypothetical protein